MTTSKPTSEELLGPGGIVREVRAPQIRMANLVAQAIAEGKHAVVEAGTGTGKGFAYLVPAILSGKRVVVSTANLALQDQLIKVDLPFLQEALADHDITFTSALVKGRSNFLCQKRFNENPIFDEGLRNWALRTQTGDRAELTTPPDPRDWAAIRADSDECPGRKDCAFGPACSYYRMRDAAEGVDVKVCNHAVLAMDLKLGGALLGDAEIIVVDEAHQLESFAADAWTTDLKRTTVVRHVRRAEKLFPEVADGNTLFARGGKSLAAIVGDAFDALFIRIGKMSENAPDTYRISLSECRDEIFAIVDVLAHVEQFVSRHMATGNKQHERLLKRFSELSGTLLEMSSKYRDNIVCWVEHPKNPGDGSKGLVIRVGPVHVGGILHETLLSGHAEGVHYVPKEPWHDDEDHGKTFGQIPWSCQRTVILTSATIATSGADPFAFFKQSIGVDECLSLKEDSPFDYPKNAMLYIPGHLDPRPSSPTFETYHNDLHNQILDLVRMSNGGAFLLFTSNAATALAFEALATPFDDGSPSPLAQLGLPASRQGAMERPALIEWFKTTPNAVLFATASFWEGVSIEGYALRLVVMDKIPFAGPGDPRRDAKRQELQARHPHNKMAAFNLMDVPEALIKLKQGFGRLIRTQDDRGMVALLDSRVHLCARQYGRAILSALPPATLVTSLDGHDLARYFDPPVPPIATGKILQFPKATTTAATL